MAQLRPAMHGAGAAGAVAFLPGIWRFFRDRDASLLGKAFVLLTGVYIVVPTDLVTDFLPVVGWLDDLGFAAIALAYLYRVSRRYPSLPAAPPAK